jgi:hypothetical protein
MSPQNLKFGILDNSSKEIPYEYSGQWAIEQTTSSNRLVIGPRAHQIALLQTLSDVMEEPFYLLYVLVVPRDYGEPGRYQTAEAHSKEDLSGFLNQFGEFMESDGRHHLWIKANQGPDLLVYDRHNVIYTYGSLEKFKSILMAEALKETQLIKIPSPHVHHYNKKYDADCRALLEYWSWHHSPLRHQDED